MAKRHKFSQTARDFVAQRAQGICEYCQMPQDFVPDAYELKTVFSANWTSNSLFELGMKDAKALFCTRNQAFASLIPNSNEKRMGIFSVLL